MRPIPVHLLLLACLAHTAYAHQQPTTLIALDIGSHQVEMHLRIPLTELELAFGHTITQRPEQSLPAWGPALKTYLLQHIRPVTVSGEPWSLQVGEMTVENAQQTQSGPFQDVLIPVSLLPPPGASLRNFTLHYDAVLHQVVTHKALVSVQSDWAAGTVEPVQLGIIAVDTGSALIPPFPIHLGEGSNWAGFTAMVALGAQHIREGTDHLLFLIVLLLPSTLLVSGRHWGAFGGSHYSLTRLVRIVTAFTIGHSVTLLAGALHWLQLPQQPVEIAIAVSILVTAVHAIRPLFPGREAQIAAGFGLVHGLAFASALAGLHLAPVPMALSILGFNLGIELMQLFIIACTVPWFILLSMTPAHPSVRLAGAVLSAIAAVGWIVNRVSGESNAIERAMLAVTRFSPHGILLLALVAITAYLYSLRRIPAHNLTLEGNQ